MGALLAFGKILGAFATVLKMLFYRSIYKSGEKAQQNRDLTSANKEAVDAAETEEAVMRLSREQRDARLRRWMRGAGGNP